jgi:hypothetical protein
MPSCTILFKNGQEQYIDIPSSKFKSYKWEEEDGFFSILGEDWNPEYGYTRIAKIRLKAINGYVFNHNDDDDNDY